MGLGSSAAEILLKIRADSKDAQSEIGKTTSALSGLSAAGGSTGAAMAAMVNPITLAVTAVTALATAGIATAAALYRLTSASAEYAGAIFDVQEKTGLSAAALSTLKVNADLAGSSLEQVGNGAAKFAKTIGEAAAGNEKAQATLKDLGVTSYDLETALGEVVKTIYDADDGTQKLVLSQKAFGRGGGELIGTIKQMGGDLQNATKEAERLGLVMSEKDLAAADAFGDSLGLLGAQAKVAGVAFTSELMPVVAKYFGMASKWFAENIGWIRRWGSTIAFTVASFARGMVIAFNVIKENAQILRGVLAGLTFGISELVYAAGQLIGKYIQAKQAASGGTAQEGSGGGGVAVASVIPSGGGKGGGAGGKSKASDAQAKAEQRAQAELEAQIALQKLALEDLENTYKKTMEAVRDEFKKTGDAFAFITGANAANKSAANGLPGILDALDALETKALKDPTSSQSLLLKKQQAARRSGIQELGAEDVKKNNDAIVEADKKMADAILKIFEDLAKAQNDVEQRRLEMWRESVVEGYLEQIDLGNDALQNQINLNAFLVEQAQFDRDAKLSGLAEEKAARRKEITDTVTDETRKRDLLAALDELYKQKALLAEDEFQRQKAEIAKKYGTIGAEDGGTPKSLGLIGSLGSELDSLGSELETLGKGAISSFANGVGSIVEQFVLLGTTGPAAMKKLTASVLAGLAAQAAVKSLFYLAEGIAALFWNPGAAVDYFKASAIMAGIALGAGGAGRAVAGNSFSQATGGGGSGSGSDTSAGNRPGLNYTTSFGGYGRNDQAIAEALNNFSAKFDPVPPEHVLVAAAGTTGGQRAIFNATLDAVQNDGSLATEFQRKIGNY